MVEGAAKRCTTASATPPSAPADPGCRVRVTNAAEFLGMEPVGDDLHWRLAVVPELTTPGNFLFGGCGLGAALVALEAASGRPTVWSTAQYLSYAPTHSVARPGRDPGRRGPPGHPGPGGGHAWATRRS